MSSWASHRLTGLSRRGLLWSAVASVLLLSYFLYKPQSAIKGAPPGPMDWIFQSWPALFAMAAATWLLLQGPLVATPSFVQKCCRFIMAFFAFAGFLYLLKWNPFWNGMRWLGFENRNKTEGFLILVSTLIWLISMLRILFGGLRLPVLFGASAVKGRPEVTKVTRPVVTFDDVGGMDEAKQQIREIVQNRMNSSQFGRYGVIQTEFYSTDREEAERHSSPRRRQVNSG